MKKLYLLLLAIVCSVGMSWAEDPDVSVDFTSSTKADFFKSFDGTSISAATPMNMGSSNSTYYVDCGSAFDASSPTSNYYEFSSANGIEKVSINFSGNGSNKSLNPILLGYKKMSTEDGFNWATPDTVIVADAQTTSSSAKTAAKAFDYTLSTDKFVLVRVCKQVKKVTYNKGGVSITSGTSYPSSTQTLRMWGFSVWESSDDCTPLAVNFAAGEGSGTMTAGECCPGKTYTIPACTFTAPAGKEFDAWTSSPSVTITDGKFTMPDEEVTLTAQWVAHVVSDDATLSNLKVGDATVAGFAPATDSYSVVLPFGTSIVPTVTATAANANAKSVVVTPAAALPGSTTVVVTAEDNTTTKTYTINFTVATTLDIEMVWDKSKKRCDGTTPAANVTSSAFAEYLSFAFAGGGAEGTSLNTSNNANGSLTLTAMDGYAFKAMSFFGKLQANCEYSIDGGAFTTLNTTSTSSDKCYEIFEDREVHEFVLRNTAANGAWIRNMQLEVIASTTSFVKHNITYVNTKDATNSNPATFIEGVGVASFAALGDVDGWHFLGWDVTSIGADVMEDVTVTASWESALSNDITLSSLKYGETSITTAAGKYAYEVELPYGTAVPVVSAIANHANAAVGEITQATEDNNYVASFTVTAENTEITKDYTVTFTWAPKLGVEIVKATLKGGTTAPTMTGFYAGEGSAKTQGLSNGGYKLGSNDHFVTINLSGENVFAAGDMVVVEVAFLEGGNAVDLYTGGTLLGRETVKVGSNYIEIPAGAVGQNTLSIKRTSSETNPTLTYIAVYRDMYYRATTADNFGTICLPFASSATSGATFYNIAGVEKNGAEITGVVLEEETGNLVAGKPYIFKATANYITVDYTGEEVNDPVSATGLVGKLSETAENIAGGANIYAIGSDNYLHNIPNDVTVAFAQNRAYIDLTNVGEATPAPGRIMMVVEGTQTATDLGSVEANDSVVKFIENGQIFIQKNGVIYNTLGQIVK